MSLKSVDEERKKKKQQKKRKTKKMITKLSGILPAIFITQAAAPTVPVQR